MAANIVKNNSPGLASSSTSNDPRAHLKISPLRRISYESYKGLSEGGRTDAVPKLQYEDISEEEGRLDEEHDHTSTELQYKEVGEYEEVKWIEEPDIFGLEDDSDDEEHPGREVLKSLKRKFSSTLFSINPMRRRLKKPRIIPGEIYVVCVDGYYRNGNKESKGIANGGFGIIIRRKGGESVVAKTGCARVGVSEFYHTIEGIKKGLELVEAYSGITRLFMMCNSDMVSHIITECFMSNKRGKCQEHPHGYDVFCKPCLSYNVSSDILDSICEFMKTIVVLGKNFCTHTLVVSCDRGMNKAADYLAKMQLAKGEETVFEPSEFPSELELLVHKMKKQGELLTHPSC